jgi:ABC-2 type transport system permease protein
MDFIGPGIIVFGILIIIPTAARTMVSDKEKGMLSRLLTTPTRPADFILGYSLGLVLIAAAQIIIIMLATWLIGLNMIGNPFLAYLVFLLTSLCCIGIGMVVASVTKTENQAEPLCWLFAMPLAALSGCWFSIDLMPSYLRTFAYAFPFAHTIDASRAILIRGVGLEAVSYDFFFLVGWAVAIFIIGVTLFRRNMRS